MRTINRTITDGDPGTTEAAMIFIPDVPATIVVTVAAGSAEVEYACDPEADIRANPASAEWVAWDYGTVSAGTPGVGSLIAPVTAMRVRPTGGNATFRATIQNPS